MAEENSGSVPEGIHHVSDPHLARILTDSAARPFFEPFIARTRSVKEAADEVGCPLDTMRYRVRVFLAAGLLRVVGERQRAGRPIKLYRSTHDAYFVPHALTPFATLEERFYQAAEPTLRAWAASVARRLQARGIEGMRLSRDRFGQVWSESAAQASSASGLDLVILDDPARPPGFDVTTTLFLADAQARELQAGLSELIAAWRPASAPGQGAPYVLSVLLYPET